MSMQHCVSWMHSLDIGSKTEQVAVHELYCSIPKEWFCEAVQKLPTRWQ
jgi:hypothetical protein